MERGSATSGRSNGMEADSVAISRPVELTTEGVKSLVLMGDSIKAYNLFREAIKVDSTYAPAKYAMADMMLTIAPDTAALYSRQAYLSDTTNHWYLDRYAQSVVAVGDYALARSLYESLIEISPLDLNAYRMLSLLYQHQGRSDDAIALLDTAEVKLGQNQYLMALKRQMLISNCQMDRAISEALAVVGESPYVAESRVVLAELYAQNGEANAAMEQYIKAVEIDSDRVQTLFSLCDFYKNRGLDRQYLEVMNKIVQSDDVQIRIKLGMVKEAIGNRELFQKEYNYFNTIITSLSILYPNNREVVEMRAQYLISIGMIEDAIEILKGHIDDEHSQMNYLRAVVELEMYQNRVDSAFRYQRVAIDRFPEESLLKFEMAYMYASQGDFDEAIEYYKMNLEGAADSLRSSIWGTVGDLLHQKIVTDVERDSTGRYTPKVVQKRMKEVYTSYKKALKYSDENAMVLNNYSYFLTENGGDLSVALDMAERANALMDGNATFLDTYGWVLYRLGRYDEAKEILRRAVTLDTTKNFEILLHFGELLSVMGEEVMSEFYWQRAAAYGAPAEMIERSREGAASNIKVNK